MLTGYDAAMSNKFYNGTQRNQYSRTSITMNKTKKGKEAKNRKDSYTFSVCEYSNNVYK